MTTNQLPPFIQALQQLSAYPHPVSGVKLVQTHISYVLLAGDFVYKIKKPVNFGFLDFTALDKRRHFCEEELRLNRRLCPSLYLEVLPITRDGDDIRLNGSGTAIEYCVKMARMPEERMMGNLIKHGQLTAVMLDGIVDLLVPFYQQAEGGEEIKAFGSAQAVGVNVLENFDQTRSFIGCTGLSQSQSDRISAYAKDFLGREALFQKRIAGDKIRDCHGDLYSANICLAEQIFIYDCIEFNQRFRYCDVASDVAFLAMDLDFHGLTELSVHFIDTFIKRSNDPGLMEMLNFYKCYRAYVRGKIGLFTAHAPEVDAATQASCLEQAKRYFELAARYAEAN
jgi:aminoglycoside phosphotransferase family enzyme